MGRSSTQELDWSTHKKISNYILCVTCEIDMYGGKIKLETIDIIPKMTGIARKLPRETYCSKLATLAHVFVNVEKGL